MALAPSGIKAPNLIKQCQKVGARKSPATVCVKEHEPNDGSHALFQEPNSRHFYFCHVCTCGIQSIYLSMDASS